MSTRKNKGLAAEECGESLAGHLRPKHQLTVHGQVVLLVVLFASLFSQNLFAQRNGTASITGSVTDSSGASVVGASVTVTNTATGVATSTKTNESGSYTLLYLQVGTYSVDVKKDGFQGAVATGLLFTADRQASMNFTLKAGTVSEKVTVNAAAQLIETETAALGQTIDEHTITELPLNGRNPASLVLLSPGMADVLSTGGGVRQTFLSFPTEEGASANGGRQGSTFYLLDGAYNMDNYHLLAGPFPNPDATQEFKVIGNNFDARYGFAPGAVVSIVTKSGTNDWHGDVFEFMRNKAVNAADYFSQKVDGLRRNQYGGSLGGPIVKNKLFVFGNYQGTRASTESLSGQAYVPNAAMLRGDFSFLCPEGFVGGICRGPNPTEQLYQDSAHTIPYQNNQVDPSTYSPGARAIASQLPLSSDRLGKIFIQGQTHRDDFDEFTIRADYNVNDRHRIMLRSYDNIFRQPRISATLLDSDRSWLVTWANQAANYTWTISPSVVNNVVVSFTRLNDNSSPGIRGANGKPICYSQFIKVADSSCEIQSLGIAGAFGVGQNYNHMERRTWGVSESINITKGRHLMVAGVDVMQQYWNLGTDWLASPAIWFGGDFTNYGIADFLLGHVQFYLQDSGEYQQLRQTQFAPYFADQIKVTPHLTVSAGLRWEPWYAPMPSSGRMEAFHPGQQSTRYPNAPLGLVYPGDAGVPSAGVPNSLNHLDPRLGFAWTPRALPKTSIRGAIGSFSVPVDYSSWNHTADTAPFSPAYNLNRYDPTVGQISFDNPWASYAPTGGKSPFPPFAGPSSVPRSNVAFVAPVYVQTVFSPKYKTAQNTSWNMSVDHQFGSNWLAQAAYVGGEEYHMQIPVDHNPGIYSTNPALNGARAYSNFSQILQYDSVGTSSYQSGQFSLQRRFANGLQFQASYTRSRTLDTFSLDTLAFTNSVPNPFNLKRDDYGVSDLDVPNIFVFNFVYRTPALSGKNLLVRSVLGGWEASGIWSARSGRPFSVYAGDDNSALHIGGDRADMVPGQSPWSHRGSRSQWLKEYYNTAAFKANAPGTIGNSARDLFYGPGFNTWDMSFDKNWNFGERYRLQFRWEMFNAFNHPSFGNPCDYVSCGATQGLITGLKVPPRVMQAAAKIYF